jgi:hypothetical protein
MNSNELKYLTKEIKKLIEDTPVFSKAKKGSRDIQR